MVYTANDISSAMTLIEYHDCRVFRLFVHPSDLPTLRRHEGFVEGSFWGRGEDPHRSIVDGANIEGSFWGMEVLLSEQVKPGEFDLSPYPGEIMSIIHEYEDRLHQPPVKKPEPARLWDRLKKVAHTRLSSLISRLELESVNSIPRGSFNGPKETLTDANGDLVSFEYTEFEVVKSFDLGDFRVGVGDRLFWNGDVVRRNTNTFEGSFFGCVNFRGLYEHGSVKLTENTGKWTVLSAASDNVRVGSLLFYKHLPVFWDGNDVVQYQGGQMKAQGMREALPRFRAI